MSSQTLTRGRQASPCADRPKTSLGQLATSAASRRQELRTGFTHDQGETTDETDLLRFAAAAGLPLS